MKSGYASASAAPPSLAPMLIPGGWVCITKYAYFGYTYKVIVIQPKSTEWKSLDHILKPSKFNGFV